jgi:hypothetical protein
VYVAKDVIMLTQDESYGTGAFSFLPTYTACWASLFFILSFIAFIFLPICYRSINRRQSNSVMIQPQRTISLQRYLVGSLGFFGMLITSIIITEQSDNRTLPTTIRIFYFSLDLLLAYHLTEKDAGGAARKYLFYLFDIDDTTTTTATRRQINGPHGQQRAAAAPESALFRLTKMKRSAVGVAPIRMESITDSNVV